MSFVISLRLPNHGMCCVCRHDENNNKDHLTEPVLSCRCVSFRPKQLWQNSDVIIRFEMHIKYDKESRLVRLAMIEVYITSCLYAWFVSVWYSCVIPTSQTECTQAAVCQLDIGRWGQLLAQLHHHTQRGLATKQDHLQVPTEQHRTDVNTLQHLRRTWITLESLSEKLTSSNSWWGEQATIKPAIDNL